MTIETDIHTALTGHAGLVALVGSQIYLGALPQSATYPAIRYAFITHSPSIYLNGGRAGLGRTVFQYDIFCKTSAEIQAIRIQLLDAIETETSFTSMLIDIMGGDSDNAQELRRLIVQFAHWHSNL